MGTVNHMDLAALAAAIDDPVGMLDYWLATGGPSSVDEVRSEVRSLVPRASDPTSTAIARLALDLLGDQPAIKTLADQFGISSSAVSQRRTKVLERVADLRSLPIAEHPLVELWRDRANRVVHRQALPAWLGAMLVAPPTGSEWGANADVAHVLIAVAVGRPVLVSEEGDQADEWLIDRNLLSSPDAKVTIRDVAETFADHLTTEGSHSLPTEDFRRSLVDWGVAPSSAEQFATLLMRKPVRRTVECDGRVLVLSRSDAKRAGDVAKLTMETFGLSKQESAELLTAQQGRNSQAVLNDL